MSRFRCRNSLFTFSAPASWPRAALALALFGALGVPVAAYVVKSLPLEAMKWVVLAVLIYTATAMFLSAGRSREPSPRADTVREAGDRQEVTE